jgi:Spirocyclase AveC-like
MTVQTSVAATVAPRPMPLTGTPAHPVKFFALLGVIIAAVFANTLFQWITGPYFKPSPVGPDPIPDWALTLIRFSEVFCGVLILVFLWVLLIKPWIRDKRMPWDGMLMLCLFTMWVQDSMCNYFNFTFSYNAYWINMGSWSSYLPGWQSPRGSNLPEPFFLMGGIYLWWTTINVLAFCWSLKKLRVWLPNHSMLVHVPIAYLVICVLDMILEIPACRTGLFAYPGAPAWATLWAGKPYQFPLYETFFMNFNYLSIGLLRHYRDDKGESWVERGVSTFSLSQRAKTVMRFFALMGFCNLSYFIVYFMPYNWMAMQADTFPTYPSYMRYEICGEGTPYACPSREVPVPSRNSLAIAPDDPRLSPTARRN